MDFDTLESFISYCDDMIIAEETYDFLPANRFITGILRDTEATIQADMLCTMVEEISVTNYPRIINFYKSFLTNDALVHIVKHHTDFMLRGGTLLPKTEYQDEIMKYCGHSIGIFSIRKNGDLKHIQKYFSVMLHMIFKRNVTEICNFKYSANSHLYNDVMGRYEYSIDHDFQTTEVGEVYIPEKDIYVTSHTVRLALGKDSEYGDPYVISMYPVLDKKDRRLFRHD